MTVASIDLLPLKAEATNTIGILTRISGVRVRQSGGFGSPAQIQLNVLSGNSVRQYYDGIPLELLNGGIQLNNIPVNTIDRIDVYKGIMPIG
ncbi:MAG: Plug domain-containing protein [Bacteroidota bacterium]